MVLPDSLHIYDLGYFLSEKYMQKYKIILSFFLRLSGENSGIISHIISHSHTPWSSKKDEEVSSGEKMSRAMSGACSRNERQDILSSMQLSSNSTRRTGCTTVCVWSSRHFSRKISVSTGVSEKNGLKNILSTMMKL